MKINVTVFKLVTLVSLIASALLLCSCREVGADTTGITVEQAPVYTYTDSSLEYAEQLIYSVLEKVETERVGEPSQSKLAKLRDLSSEISKIAANGMISEERYLSVIREIYGEREVISGVICNKLPLASAEPLWRDVITAAGRDYASELLFELLLLDFENKRESALEEYETGGAGYQLALAEKHAKNILTLKREIGRENLSLLLDYAFILCELAIDPSLDEVGVSLSDGEILMLINYLDPAEIKMSAAGWELALTLPADAVLSLENPGFISKMYFAAAKNGDVEKIASQMQEVISLIRAVRSYLTTDTVADVRAGDGAAAVTDILNEFNTEDFERLDRILSIELQNSEYSTLARDYYGAAYEEYLDGIRVYTVEELIAAKGTDSIYETLKGYIAGRCPALSYAIFCENDKM